MEAAAGGDWYSVYNLLENRASAVVQSSGNHLFQMMQKRPDCQILPIFFLNFFFPDGSVA